MIAPWFIQSTILIQQIKNHGRLSICSPVEELSCLDDKDTKTFLKSLASFYKQTTLLKTFLQSQSMLLKPCCTFDRGVTSVWKFILVSEQLITQTVSPNVHHIHISRTTWGFGFLFSKIAQPFYVYHLNYVLRGQQCSAHKHDLFWRVHTTRVQQYISFPSDCLATIIQAHS